jgi:hypothetical protein
MLDVVVLVSGDGDYVDLGEYIKSRGRIFHVASFRESSSTSLVNTADIYTNFSDEKSLYLISNTRTTVKKSNKSTQEKAIKKTTKTKTSTVKKTTSVKPKGTGKATSTKTKAQNAEEAEEYRSRRLSF